MIWSTLQVPQFLGPVNNRIITTVSIVCSPVEQSQTEMNMPQQNPQVSSSSLFSLHSKNGSILIIVHHCIVNMVSDSAALDALCFEMTRVPASLACNASGQKPSA